MSYVTPWSEPLEEGAYVIEMPASVQVGIETYNFKQWEDGSTNPKRTINLFAEMSLFATYELGPPIRMGCFIATAAYGSTCTPQLKVLRWFRDRCLPKKAANVYYKLSPPLAKLIWDYPHLRIATQIWLTPIITVVKHLRGVMEKWSK